jgi:hypothetical protein
MTINKFGFKGIKSLQGTKNKKSILHKMAWYLGQEGFGPAHPFRFFRSKN